MKYNYFTSKTQYHRKKKSKNVGYILGGWCNVFFENS
jgi:hypothetical protein